VLTKRKNPAGKSGHVNNMDESGFQMNSGPATVISKKGSSTLYQMTSGEEGGTVSVMAMPNTVLYFQTGYLKGTTNKKFWEELIAYFP
jgi:hypothetical protein